MSTRASARLANMPPFASPLTKSWMNSCTSVAEVRAPHRFLSHQFGAGTADRDPSHLQHVSVARYLQGQPCVLLHQEDCDAVGLVDGADDLEDRAYDDRGAPKRRFVQKHEPGPHQQSSRHSQHLL